MDTKTTDSYYRDEQLKLLKVFETLLAAASGDGATKRAAGTKPPWWRDPDHAPAVWSHFKRHAQGELKDEDSGAHPYVHAAWRLLAIAYQETYGRVEPEVAMPELFGADYYLDQWLKDW